MRTDRCGAFTIYARQLPRKSDEQELTWLGQIDADIHGIRFTAAARCGNICVVRPQDQSQACATVDGMLGCWHGRGRIPVDRIRSTRFIRICSEDGGNSAQPGVEY